MDDRNRLVMKRSVPLWIATIVVTALNIGLAMSHQPDRLVYALAATGLLGIAGIGFGIWAGVTLHRR